MPPPTRESPPRAGLFNLIRDRLSPRAWMAIGGAVVVVGAGVGIGLAATSSKHVAATTTTTTLPPTTTSTAPPAVCPLTHLPAPGGIVPARPALAVKIDNYPAARPQSGMDKADIIFEEPVEGFITRFVAVFQCQDSSYVGPVRSERAIDAQILDQLSHPALFHVGGIDQVAALMSAQPITDVDLRTHGGLEINNPNRVAPYRDYLSTSSAWGLLSGDNTAPVSIFTFGGTAPAGSPITSVNIPFSATSNETWTWSPAAAPGGLWVLSYSGVPFSVTGGGQFSVPNVVIQSVNVTLGPWVENAGGGLEVMATMTGSGPVMVLRGGQAISGTWQRPSLTSPTSFVTANGTVIPLLPGQTWVDVVPSSIAVTTH